jgi:hypothetical protein
MTNSKRITAKSKTGKAEEAKKEEKTGVLYRNLFDLAVKISFKTLGGVSKNPVAVPAHRRKLV